MAVIKKKAQGGRGRYATLEQVVNYVEDHGYELRWPTDVKDGRLYVNTMIRRQGESKWEDTCCWIPVEVGDSRGMSVMQALGSALTYARRYSTLAAFGLATTDDDGETSGYRRHGSGGMTDDQQQAIDRILNEYKVAPGFESQFISKVLNRGVAYKQLTGLDAQQFIDSYNNIQKTTNKEETNGNEA
ncbi:ERF family protein [Bifidobacterium sp. SO1]|uniref:ERF family protein n=1 Tax=Bifidobacterium sp. SO1 TaxID=2809029 RepID=UPI001BDD7FF2|nr:ERF family protein [Bifidobacterium sp. SO1]MBT1161274.1 ERF family protein [Bifidobacterium sp. SO1]